MSQANRAFRTVRATGRASTALPTAESVNFLVADRSRQVYGHVNDITKHPLYWVSKSDDSEMSFNLQSFEKVELRASLVPESSVTEDVKTSLESIVTKVIDTSKDKVTSTITSVLTTLRGECNRELPFILHGCRVHEKQALKSIIQQHLGKEVEAFGVTWRWICEDAANTAPHYDEFSGWNLLISINEAGAFHLNIHEGRRLVAKGPVELPFQISVMLMAGAHSHERALNPFRLLHSGSTTSGTRRLLLRLSLKGQVDVDMMKKVDFTKLLAEIAGLEILKYYPALGSDSAFAVAKAAEEAGDPSPAQLQLLKDRRQDCKYVCVDLYMY